MYREYLTKFASLYNKESYYKLQEILRKETCDITYSKASLIDLPKKFEGPYDLIVLGNIFQYYKTIPCLDTPYDVNNFVKKELSKLLAPDGTILVNYAFEVGATCVRIARGEPYTKTPFNTSFRGRQLLKEQMKKDINVALLKRGGYDFYAIAGVESLEEPRRPMENIILTYTPSKQK